MVLDVARMQERPRTTLEERVELLEAKQAIHDLVLLYGWLCDARLWDELLDNYTDDFERTLLGTLDEHIKGKEAIRPLYEAPKLPRKEGTSNVDAPAATQLQSYELRHMIHPPVIRVADDGRTATVAAVYSLVASTGDGPDFRRGEHEGGYIFGMRKEDDGRWKFASMIVISENARNPLFRAS